MTTQPAAQDEALYGGNTTSSTQYNPSHQRNGDYDLERLNTVSTILGPNAGSLSVEPHKRFRDFGNPSPLGLSAFALTTLVLSLINVRARHIAEPNIVIGLAFFYGGLVQLLAGMWEFAVGNTFGATALSSYGGFWLSFGAIFVPWFNIAAAYPEEAELGAVLGVYLAGWAIFTFLLLLCTLKSTVTFFSLFFTLTMAFVLLSAGYFRIAEANHVPLIKAGGYFGLASALLAWYNALAGLVENHNSFFAVPTMPFPWSEAGRTGRRSSRGSALRDEKSS